MIRGFLKMSGSINLGLPSSIRTGFVIVNTRLEELPARLGCQHLSCWSGRSRDFTINLTLNSWYRIGIRDISCSFVLQGNVDWRAVHWKQDQLDHYLGHKIRGAMSLEMVLVSPCHCMLHSTFFLPWLWLLTFNTQISSNGLDEVMIGCCVQFGLNFRLIWSRMLYSLNKEESTIAVLILKTHLLW